MLLLNLIFILIVVFVLHLTFIALVGGFISLDVVIYEIFAVTFFTDERVFPFFYIKIGVYVSNHSV